MTANPVEAVYPSGSDVSKADVIAHTKLRLRQRVADADEIRNTDFTGQHGGLRVAALDADYDLNTADTTTADDLSPTSDCIRDTAGNGFFRVAPNVTETQRKVTAAGSVTIAADDSDIIVIAKTVGAATAVALPSAADRSKPVRIVDGKYDAATNNITISPDGSETIMGGASYVIDSNGASIILTPLADGSGWI